MREVWGCRAHPVRGFGGVPQLPLLSILFTPLPIAMGTGAGGGGLGVEQTGTLARHMGFLPKTYP